MNLLLLQQGELGPAGDVVLDGRRADHLLKTLDATVGQELRAAVVGQGRGLATVTKVPGDGTVHVRFQGGAAELPPHRATTLILALPRPKELPRVLQAAASFGVGAIHLVNAWRVEKSYWSTPKLEAGALTEQLTLGAEQGGHDRVPELQQGRLLMPYLKTEWSVSRDGQPRRLIAHPRGTRPIEHIAREPAPTTIAIGPEGGWIDDELAAFEAVGFHRVQLVTSVLRTGPAVVAALAQLELLRR